MIQLAKKPYQESTLGQPTRQVTTITTKLDVDKEGTHLNSSIIIFIKFVCI
jgi:hypothetical protein